MNVNGKGFNGVFYNGHVPLPGRRRGKGLRGYMWLLGRRLYFKTSWRARDTYYLGRVEDPLTASARLRRLLPKPVDVRTVVAAVAKTLAMALYIARRYRESPKWRNLSFEVNVFTVLNSNSPKLKIFNILVGIRYGEVNNSDDSIYLISSSNFLYFHCVYSK